MKTFRILLLCLVLPFVAQVRSAQGQDAAGCKDSPLVPRYPGSVITECHERAFDGYDFTLTVNKQNVTKRIEGNFLRISYNWPKTTATKTQVVHLLNSALRKAGYTFDYDSGDYGDFTAHSGKTWIMEEVSGGGGYSQTIVVDKQLPQSITAKPASDTAAGAGGQTAAASTSNPKDAKGCKDSPLISRYTGSIIDSCRDKDFDAYDFTITVDKQQKSKRIEGVMHQNQYNWPHDIASKTQVVHNLNNAFKAAGYTFDYDSGEYGDFTVHMGKTWIMEEVSGGGWYKQTIVVEKGMTQEIVANAAALSGGLTGNGHVVVNGILFDTGKTDVKPESAAALTEIAKMLKANPRLKVYVVGHTDNVGALAANMDLSKRRAASVVQALTTKYAVPAAQLDAIGDGPSAPVSSNDTEDGRALNRRVELVKQ
jgi:outer membrane protein OmpA-like peptidoglycan-associated protein